MKVGASREDAFPNDEQTLGDVQRIVDALKDIQLDKLEKDVGCHKSVGSSRNPIDQAAFDLRGGGAWRYNKAR